MELQKRQKAKKLGRYLISHPRLVYNYSYQNLPKEVRAVADSDWAGDKVSRKSTSGGIAFRGKHCIKSWSSNQTIIALSSAEAELYALLKGACVKSCTICSSFGDTGFFPSLPAVHTFPYLFVVRRNYSKHRQCPHTAQDDHASTICIYYMIALAVSTPP